MTEQIKYDGCPDCGAKTEDEAESMCFGREDCAMCVKDDWQESLDYINRLAKFNEDYVAEIEKNERP